MLEAAPLPARSTDRRRRQSGRSSGVEHNLAKVGVEGSNPFARSSFHSNSDRWKLAAAAGFSGREQPIRARMAESSPLIQTASKQVQNLYRRRRRFLVTG